MTVGLLPGCGCCVTTRERGIESNVAVVGEPIDTRYERVISKSG
jgi:hypothetical protein